MVLVARQERERDTERHLLSIWSHMFWPCHAGDPPAVDPTSRRPCLERVTANLGMSHQFGGLNKARHHYHQHEWNENTIQKCRIINRRRRRRLRNRRMLITNRSRSWAAESSLLRALRSARHTRSRRIDDPDKLRFFARSLVFKRRQPFECVNQYEMNH